MVGVKGYDAAILDALTRHGVWIVSKSSNANTITHYLSASADAVKKVIADLQKTYPDAAISAQPVAMVAAIGSDISRPGLVPHALRALDVAGIAMIAMQHQIISEEHTSELQSLMRTSYPVFCLQTKKKKHKC